METTIQIAVGRGAKVERREVDAEFCADGLCVTREADIPGYCVTHIRSGRRVVSCGEKTAAALALECLKNQGVNWDKCLSAISRSKRASALAIKVQTIMIEAERKL